MAGSQVTLSLTYALHMLATVVWIGGLLYQSFFLLPELRKSPDRKHARALLERLRSRFQPIAWLCLMVLVGTGLIQMSAHPAYSGLLAIENTWSKAMLFKHIAVALMTLLAGYQSFILYPRITRTLLLKSAPEGGYEAVEASGGEMLAIRLNSLLSLLVLLLTAIARTA